MTWMISAITVVGLLILIHEAGHFIVAKLCGVGVVRFAIGFGPTLIKFKYGETEYSLGAIPLGGYVRMVGDMPDAITGKQATDDVVRGDEVVIDVSDIPPEMLADKTKWFIEKTLFQRSSIVIAGPLFNLISALLFVFFAIFIYGEDVPVKQPIIGSVMDDSPAQAGGVKTGDQVLTLNGKKITDWENLAQTIHDGTGEPISLRILRAGVEQTISVVPKARMSHDASGAPKNVFLIGIEQDTDKVVAGLFRSMELSGLWVYNASIRTLTGLVGMATGNISPKEIAGPIFIFKAAGKQAEKGLESTLYFMALLSVSLAVLNLLPIPILDGGHLFFFLVEAIFGPMSIRKKEFAQQVGLVFLLFLTCFAITNDIRRPTESSRWQSMEVKDKPPAAENQTEEQQTK
jgi:regulator of sigma E protease